MEKYLPHVRFSCSWILESEGCVFGKIRWFLFKGARIFLFLCPDNESEKLVVAAEIALEQCYASVVSKLFAPFAAV